MEDFRPSSTKTTQEVIRLFDFIFSAHVFSRQANSGPLLLYRQIAAHLDLTFFCAFIRCIFPNYQAIVSGPDLNPISLVCRWCSPETRGYDRSFFGGCAPRDPRTNRDLNDAQRAWRNPMATDEPKLSKLVHARSRRRAPGVVLPLFLD